ncbi:cyclohexadienyl dehydratase [Seinonella peptonophila]|uniref:Cyclohexadienyl dehydratase n=1 Tax=Seinonella peptonophila TaxID=112248 RepID=A0A1M4U0R2_9BACL|nr:transporter substrate-binding domain-containing protein [Seinonella peptonophila]SHE50318.1 cyclohexadienyl dehydratase [Seinonella peptonophila]
MQKRLAIFMLTLVLLITGFVTGSYIQKGDAQPIKKMSRLDLIVDQGVIRVGTTGDYKPFTYLNPQTKEYEGYDIDAAKMLAKDLGVKVKFVKTTWPTLMSDLKANKFDIAMGGITRTLEREKTAHLTLPYIKDGKSPLIRKADQDRFKSLADIDQQGVKIGVNPGGTNEKFVRENLKKAEIVLVQNNLEIPNMVAEGKVDVMITDSTEARYYAKQNDKLLAILTENPFNLHQKGYLINRSDVDYQNWINLWMEEMQLHGQFKALEKKWIN